MSSKPSSARLHVVVTCTDRKTRAVSPELRVGSLLAGPLESRVQVWTAALESSRAEAVAAEYLYAGDHWRVVRTLGAAAPLGIEVETWVCSAGYGLCHLSTPMRPYAATFASTHPDSVAPRQMEYTTSEWWQCLAKWRPGALRGPRTVAELAATSPNDFVLVAISGTYATALSADLEKAARFVGDVGRLAVISVGSRPTPLRRHFVPAAARLKVALGGAMQSLNARIARRAIEKASDWYPSRDLLARLLQSWVDGAPAIETHDRQKLDDDAVRTCIRLSLEENPRLAHTQLLRALRDSGRACEQARFAALFREVRAGMGARTEPALNSIGPGADRP